MLHDKNVTKEALLVFINTKLTALLQDTRIDNNNKDDHIQLYVLPNPIPSTFFNDHHTYGFVGYSNTTSFEEKKKRIIHEKPNQLGYIDPYFASKEMILLSDKTQSIRSMLVRDENNGKTLYIALYSHNSEKHQDDIIVKYGQLCKIDRCKQSKSWKDPGGEISTIEWESLESEAGVALVRYKSSGNTLEDHVSKKQFDSVHFDSRGFCNLQFSMVIQNETIIYTLKFKVQPLGSGMMPKVLSHEDTVN